MPFSPRIESALEDFRRVRKAGRLPHALLISGHPRGSGADFLEGFLSLLFPSADSSQLRQHADIRWIEPEGKARQIKVEESRKLIQFMSLTSYEGGAKAGIILFADRLNPNAQNALLKILEEPPPNTYLLLVTETVAGLLTTIRSRTQVVDVMEEGGELNADWGPVVLDLLRHPPLRKACEMMAWTDRLTAPLRQLKALAEAEEEARAEAEAERLGKASGQMTKATKDLIDGRVATRVKEMREELLRTILLWQRDVLARAAEAEPEPLNFPQEASFIVEQAGGLSFAEASRRVAVVHEIRELLEHNIRESVALLRMARAFSTPVS